MKILKVAISQHAPVYLDLSASLDKAADIIKEAAAQKCELLAFGETWLSGYPVWLDYAPQAALWDHVPTKELYALMHENSIVVPGPELSILQQLARENEMAICMGINEKVSAGPGHGTLYNAIITINNQGELVNHHRKLMPTFTEKMVYGLGDAKGLQVSDMGEWHMGSLVCWEHWMPLSRQVLHNLGEQIHVALWPRVHEMHQIASRHYAFEGRCYVLAVGQVTSSSQLPASMKIPGIKDGELLLNGGSAIIGPDGFYVQEPVFNKEQLLVATLDLSRIREEQMTLDVSGHYSRPDVFEFKVRTDDS